MFSSKLLENMAPTVRGTGTLREQKPDGEDLKIKTGTLVCDRRSMAAFTKPFLEINI